MGDIYISFSYSKLTLSAAVNILIKTKLSDILIIKQMPAVYERMDLL